jgi:Tat protein translocase TatB subunit
MFSDVFGMGITEILLIGAVALMLFSPKELPSIIKTLARFYGSVRRTADEFRNQIMETDELRDIRHEFHRTRADVRNAKAAAQREIDRVKLEATRSRADIESTLREGRDEIEQRVRSEANAPTDGELGAPGDALKEMSTETSSTPIESPDRPAREHGAPAPGASSKMSTKTSSAPLESHGRPVTDAPQDPEQSPDQRRASAR